MTTPPTPTSAAAKEAAHEAHEAMKKAVDEIPMLLDSLPAQIGFQIGYKKAATVTADLQRQLAEAPRWQTGTPDVPEGKQEQFWCEVQPSSESRRRCYQMLCYGNKHVMPLSDACDGPPANAVPVPEDDTDYYWTGWWEESCDQCDTYWSFNGTVLAWMKLPKRIDAAAQQAGKEGAT